jgi:hypothetical protein
MFENCVIEKIELSQSKLKDVDFSSSELRVISGIESFRGATVSQQQLYDLAPYIAREFGIIIEPS